VESRAHFFGIAATMMRRILVDMPTRDGRSDADPADHPRSGHGKRDAHRA
jgi:hypothetical protein